MKLWPVKPLGTLVDFVGGGTPRRDRSDYWGGPIPWASVKDLQNESLETTVETITVEGLKNSASNLIPAGTVIIASRVGLGKVAINQRPVAINQDLKALTPRSEELSSRYLLQFLRSKAEYFERIGVGATVKGLTIADYQKLDLPVPPLAEQERIVKLLDEADAQRKLRAQADRRTAALLPALFDELFGAGGNECLTITLEDAIERFIDYRGKTPVKSSSGVPLVTAKIVKGGSILPATEFISAEIYDKWMSRGLPKTGDILFTMEAPLGEMAIVENTRIALAQRILLLRPRAELLDSRYLVSALKMPSVWNQIKERATGSTVLGIRQAELRKIQIPVPPLPLQQTFARRVAEIRELEAAQAAARRRLDALFASILHRAFAGEL